VNCRAVSYSGSSKPLVWARTGSRASGPRKVLDGRTITQQEAGLGGTPIRRVVGSGSLFVSSALRRHARLRTGHSLAQVKASRRTEDWHEKAATRESRGTAESMKYREIPRSLKRTRTAIGRMMEPQGSCTDTGTCARRRDPPIHCSHMRFGEGGCICR